MHQKQFITLGALAAAAAVALPLSAVVAEAATTSPDAEPAFCRPYQAAVAQFSSDAPDPTVAGDAVAAMAADVPSEIADAVTVVIDTATTALGGDPSVFDSTPEFFPALGTIDAWMFDNCAFDARVDVLATDYAFGGLPDELPSGHSAIRLTNDGSEIHEIVLVRRLEGTTESWDELAHQIAAEDPAAMAKVEFVGGAFSQGPEMPGVAVVDLVPGDYAALCFVPVGTLQGTDVAAPPASDDPGSSVAMPEYDPHFAHGMMQEFTVVEG